MQEMLMALASQYPMVMSIVMVVGGLRIVVKPIMGLLKELALYTPSPKDDELIGKVESSAFYKGLVYVLDWFASVKLPGAK